MRGTLFVVAAPSGAGKSSIVNACLARDPNIALSISFTSRAPRPARHAEHYHFITADAFKAMIRAGDFFEYAECTATGRAPPGSRSAAARCRQDVLLEIDWQGRAAGEGAGAGCGERVHPAAVARALEERMRKRADSEEVIAQRLANAREEMSHHGEFDYVIVNGCSTPRSTNVRHLHRQSLRRSGRSSGTGR